MGLEIKFKETKLTAQNISESNVILFNGKLIEAFLPEARASESHCESCSEITGKSTSCRIVEFGGNTYEGISASLIRQAVCQITQCSLANCQTNTLNAHPSGSRPTGLARVLRRSVEPAVH